MWPNGHRSQQLLSSCFYGTKISAALKLSSTVNKYVLCPLQACSRQPSVLDHVLDLILILLSSYLFSLPSRHCRSSQNHHRCRRLRHRLRQRCNHHHHHCCCHPHHPHYWQCWRLMSTAVVLWKELQQNTHPEIMLTVSCLTGMIRQWQCWLGDRRAIQTVRNCSIYAPRFSSEELHSRGDHSQDRANSTTFSNQLQQQQQTQGTD